MSTLTVGTISEKVVDAGVAVDGVTLKDGGATFTSDVTIGDASASDKKILFDGNAVDYHIGLDDSADSLIIGKGSALGTTTSMAINADGIITKPLQPAFLAKPTSDQLNNAVTVVTVIFGTEVYDQNADFASNIFTAPVTGKYHLETLLRLQAVDSGANYYIVQIATSNRSYHFIFSPLQFNGDLTYWGITATALADMDAGDTAYVTIQQNGGTGQTDISTTSHFAGYLAC